MGNYSGRLTIKNETIIDKNSDSYKEDGHIITMKFSVCFNGKRIHLSNNFVQELLESGAVKNFLIEDSKKIVKENSDYIEDEIKKVCNVSGETQVKIKVIGYYMFLKLYCNKHSRIDDCMAAIKRKLNKKKSTLEILRG